jgi:hypothetical protein
MAEKKRVPFTREGYERVSQELKELVEIKRPEIIEAVADARSHGDLRENAAYDVARQDQAMIEKRISDLEDQLRNAHIIEDDPNGAISGIVSLGRLHARRPGGGHADPWVDLRGIPHGQAAQGAEGRRQGHRRDPRWTGQDPDQGR